MSLRPIAFALLLPACQGSPQPLPAFATTVAPTEAPRAAAAPTVVAAPEPDRQLQDRMEDLELELAQLKLVIEEMKVAGVGSMNAENVQYQPNRTTMSARDVASALDELWNELHRLQEGATDMGPPGELLFSLDEGPLGPRHDPREHEPPGEPAGPPPGQGPPPGGHPQ